MYGPPGSYDGYDSYWASDYTAPPAPIYDPYYHYPTGPRGPPPPGIAPPYVHGPRFPPGPIPRHHRPPVPGHFRPRQPFQRKPQTTVEKEEDQLEIPNNSAQLQNNGQASEITNEGETTFVQAPEIKAETETVMETNTSAIIKQEYIEDGFCIKKLTCGGIEFDSNLPKELVALFERKSCDLCDVKLNGAVQSTTHYSGKPHLKKIKTWLQEHAEKTGEPPIKLAKIEPPAPSKKKKLEELDLSILYCAPCDLNLTSAQHAEQHYNGRNHMRRANGLTPLRTGYYNRETGKWQRTPPDVVARAEILPTVVTNLTGLPLPPGEETTTTTAVEGNDGDKKGRLLCELCKVAATTKEELDRHMIGRRHLIATKKQKEGPKQNTWNKKGKWNRGGFRGRGFRGGPMGWRMPPWRGGRGRGGGGGLPIPPPPPPASVFQQE
ncbi:unnamed protein product [Meganyctiphanes norvegica]|uniref:U1-type domain-containing protein n=1 Tax=Meganyctiphanes norvegica TaxID=48144 RepID=A0AAV2RPL7_MEGNR